MDTTDQPIEETSIPLEPSHRDRVAPSTLFLLIISALFTVACLGVFTPFGNSKISSFIQDKLSVLTGCPVTVSAFRLTPQTLTLTAVDEHDNTIRIKSLFHLFPPSIDGNYSVDFPSHTNPLETPLQSVGSVTGGYHRLNLVGKATLFTGDIDYTVTLSSLKLRKAQLSVVHLDYPKLMKHLHYPHQSDTVADGNITIDGIDTRDIVVKGFLNAKTTHFTPSPLKPDDNESFSFWELFADKEGKIAPFAIDTSIDAHIDELGILEQFVSYPLRTPATAHLNIQGTQQKLNIEINGQIAQGNTHATVDFIRLKPKHFTVDIKNTNASSLFGLFTLPSPIEGKLSGHIDSNFTNSAINLTVHDAKTNPAILKQHYHITQPIIRFNSSIKINISPDAIHTRGAFKSNLGALTIESSPTHSAMTKELLRQIKHNSYP